MKAARLLAGIGHVSAEMVLQILADRQVGNDAAQEVFTVPVPVHSFPLQDAVPLASIASTNGANSAITPA